jgi:hypothetical protein
MGARPQVQPYGLVQGRAYVVASNFGPTFTGQMGALGFVNGVAVSSLGEPRDRFVAHELSGATIQVWEHCQGHDLRWNVDCWEYLPVAPPAAVPPPSKPMRKAKAKRRRKSK